MIVVIYASNALTAVYLYLADYLYAETIYVCMCIKFDYLYKHVIRNSCVNFTRIST